MLGLCIPQRHSESSPSFPIGGAWRNRPLGALANYEKVSWVQGQGCWVSVVCTGADTALLSGMAILGRTPLTAGLRVTWDIFQISCCCYSPSLNQGLIVSLSTLWSPRNLLSLGFKGFGFESSFYLLVLLFIHCFCKPYCLFLLIYSNCLFYILVSCLF